MCGGGKATQGEVHVFSVLHRASPAVAAGPGCHPGSAPACLTASLRTRPERDFVLSHHSREVVDLDPTRHSGSEACALGPQLCCLFCTRKQGAWASGHSRLSAEGSDSTSSGERKLGAIVSTKWAGHPKHRLAGQ